MNAYASQYCGSQADSGHSAYRFELNLFPRIVQGVVDDGDSVVISCWRKVAHYCSQIRHEPGDQFDGTYLVPRAGGSKPAFKDSATSDAVAKTNQAAILAQHGNPKVRNL